MATRAVQGKNSSIYVDGINASEFLNEFEFESERDDIDVTPFESDDKVFISGSAENTVTLTGYWNGDEDSLDQMLDDTFGTDEQNVITIFPGGVASGKACYLAAATQVSYNVSAAADEQIEAEAEFRSARVRGVVLKTPVTVSATGNGAEVVSLAATTRGATANLHVLSISGAPTSADIVVETSADGDTWTPLLSFNAVAVGGYTKSTLKTETVMEQLRVTHTITGGTTPSLNYVLAVGRRA
jgi:hypothetical protein